MPPFITSLFSLTLNTVPVPPNGQKFSLNKNEMESNSLHRVFWVVPPLTLIKGKASKTAGG